MKQPSSFKATKCMKHTRAHQKQMGASLVEFSIVALSVVVVFLFSLQLGLLYHAKTVINYAVFEAARVGAVNNANMSSMRNELGVRLAPLQGGDGSSERADKAILWSVSKINDPVNTSIKVLNPTLSAFDDWAVDDPATGDRFIPVNQLRHQSYDVGAQSGLSLRDANLLKIQVTHGVDLHVPIAGRLLTKAMQLIDLEHAEFYIRGKWPVQAVATVRMQSDSLESEIMKSASLDDGAGGGTTIGAEDEGADGIESVVVAEAELPPLVNRYPNSSESSGKTEPSDSSGSTDITDSSSGSASTGSSDSSNGTDQSSSSDSNSSQSNAGAAEPTDEAPETSTDDQQLGCAADHIDASDGATDGAAQPHSGRLIRTAEFREMLRSAGIGG